MTTNQVLPDITSLRTDVANPLTLQWVGMEKIAISVIIGQKKIAAKADIFVSLDDPSAKGIHMSRLHKRLNELAQVECNDSSLHALLAGIIDSQNGLSQRAKLVLSFELLLEKPSLTCQNSGFQSYPITISALLSNNKLTLQLSLAIPYSSTCPCSASLSRQLYRNAVDQAFSDDTISKAHLLDWIENVAGSVATPHSQRSFAYLTLVISPGTWPEFDKLIHYFENVIGTPVQTAVKREDEQAFAKLNANNLLFCEDAARRIKAALLSISWIDDFYFKVEHQESLHAHNAVVTDSKYKGERSPLEDQTYSCSI